MRNVGAGLLVATSARLTLAARGAPHEWHEDEYWVADSGAKNRSLHPETGLLEIKARRRTDMKETIMPLTTVRSMVTSRADPRQIMEFHRLLGHPSEEITRGTARMSGVPLTGTWNPCVQCSESGVRRYAVPKSTESRTNERAERFFIDITGPFHVTSFGGNRCTMLYVNDFTRFKFIRFLEHESDAAKELRELVAEHIAPASIKIGIVRTDGGGEFGGEFQSLLEELEIKREMNRGLVGSIPTGSVTLGFACVETSATSDHLAIHPLPTRAAISLSTQASYSWGTWLGSSTIGVRSALLYA